MNIKTALNIIGNRTIWEIYAIKNSLSMLPLLNTDKENLLLEACNVVLGIDNHE